jgi:hypothetical protein
MPITASAAGRLVLRKGVRGGGESSADLRVRIERQTPEQSAAIHSVVGSQGTECALCALGQPHLGRHPPALRLAGAARTAGTQTLTAGLLVSLEVSGREVGAHPHVLERQQALYHAPPISHIQAGGHERAQRA